MAQKISANANNTTASKQTQSTTAGGSQAPNNGFENNYGNWNAGFSPMNSQNIPAIGKFLQGIPGATNLSAAGRSFLDQMVREKDNAKYDLDISYHTLSTGFGIIKVTKGFNHIILVLTETYNDVVPPSMKIDNVRTALGLTDTAKHRVIMMPSITPEDYVNTGIINILKVILDVVTDGTRFTKEDLFQYGWGLNIVHDVNRINNMLTRSAHASKPAYTQAFVVNIGPVRQDGETCPENDIAVCLANTEIYATGVPDMDLQNPAVMNMPGYFQMALGAQKPYQAIVAITEIISRFPLRAIKGLVYAAAAQLMIGDGINGSWHSAYTSFQPGRPNLGFLRWVDGKYVPAANLNEHQTLFMTKVNTPFLCVDVVAGRVNDPYDNALGDERHILATELNEFFKTTGTPDALMVNEVVSEMPVTYHGLVTAKDGTKVDTRMYDFCTVAGLGVARENIASLLLIYNNQPMQRVNVLATVGLTEATKVIYSVRRVVLNPNMIQWINNQMSRGGIRVYLGKTGQCCQNFALNLGINPAAYGALQQNFMGGMNAGHYQPTTWIQNPF